MWSKLGLGLFPGHPAETVIKWSRFQRNPVLIMWCNYDGAMHFELTLKGQVIFLIIWKSSSYFI